MKMFPPMPDNISGNAKQNLKLQELGKQFFHGDQFANQYASRPPVDPAMPVPPNPVNEDMFMQPFSKKVEAKEQTPEHPVKPKPPMKPDLPREKVGRLTTKVAEPLETPPRPALNLNGEPKSKAYVVNKRPNPFQPGTEDRSRDTLWLDNSYKKMAGSMIDEDDYEKLSKQALGKGTYERVLVEDLEDQGEIKIKK